VVTVLAGDIGGTKTRLGIFEVSGKGLQTLSEERYISREYSSFYEIVTTYMDRQKFRPDLACFGVAGPVRKGAVLATNLPWHIETDRLALELTMESVWLINDLEANAWGIRALGEEDLLTLNQGEADPLGNASIISAGTGLGEAGLYNLDGRLYPFASEGGHGDFSPRTEKEIALLKYLQKKYTHVSWERILSGKGLSDLYDFLEEYHDEKTPPWLEEKMRESDRAASISWAAGEGRCPLCLEAMEIFLSLYGIEAGNHALKLMATSGVYIGGGIAAKNRHFFSASNFLRHFFDKGRLRPLMEKIPVKVIINERAALYGAALYASYRAGEPEVAISGS